jgi:drug/metabolite transporter superfamily protein YnfA
MFHPTGNHHIVYGAYGGLMVVLMVFFVYVYFSIRLDRSERAGGHPLTVVA